MKKIILLIASLSIMGCVFIEPYDAEKSIRMQERRIRWAIERQLNHQRIVNDCQLYNSCRGEYKIYNSNYKRRK